MSEPQSWASEVQVESSTGHCSWHRAPLRFACEAEATANARAMAKRWPCAITFRAVGTSDRALHRLDEKGRLRDLPVVGEAERQARGHILDERTAA